jgi:phytoene synthase
MMTFYAFCRVVDDIGDEDIATPEVRRQMLHEWREGLLHGFANADELQQEVAQLPARYPIDRALMAEIIDGVESDLDHQFYETHEEVLAYCYKVACAVGLVSIEIFGYTNPDCKKYAVALGYALQLTNIIRDVGEDASNGRIYLPLEDLRRFNVTEQQLLEGTPPPSFEALMEFQYQRAVHYYKVAESFLPHEDRHRMLAAEMMAQVYHEILEKIRRHRFRVFEKRIGLSKFRKFAILGAYTARGIMGAV